MVSDSTTLTADGVAWDAPSRSWPRAMVDGWTGRIGLVLTVGVVALALVGPAVAPHSPTGLVGPILESPSAKYPLGTDWLGRDVLSRVLSGGRTLIVLPILSVILAFGVGGMLGLVAGYVRGLADLAVTRVVDVLMSIPPLLLVMVFILILGSSNLVLVTVTAFFFAPRIVRVVRGATRSVAEKEYVQAARVRGESTLAIIARELVPNITGTLLVEFALRINFAIIFIATLNFLGLGVQLPSSDWGLTIAQGRTYLLLSPLLVLVPAACIAALTIGINLLADQAATILARTEPR